MRRCCLAAPAAAHQADALAGRPLRGRRRGAVERVRPKMMTVTAIMAGLLPIMWGHGTGSEVMRRIAAPMIGGMVTSTVLTLWCCP
nr:efflux RND transporter permease subunit [Rhodocaloribacter litoris]